MPTRQSSSVRQAPPQLWPGFGSLLSQRPVLLRELRWLLGDLGPVWKGGGGCAPPPPPPIDFELARLSPSLLTQPLPHQARLQRVQSQSFQSMPKHYSLALVGLSAGKVALWTAAAAHRRRLASPSLLTPPLAHPPLCREIGFIVPIQPALSLLGPKALGHAPS